MTLGELFEETYIQGEIAIRSYDSTGTTIEHYLGDAEELRVHVRARLHGHHEKWCVMRNGCARN